MGNESSNLITQIDFARAGQITPAMRVVAEKEGRGAEFIREGVAAGCMKRNCCIPCRRPTRAKR